MKFFEIRAEVLVSKFGYPAWSGRSNLESCHFWSWEIKTFQFQFDLSNFNPDFSTSSCLTCWFSNSTFQLHVDPNSPAHRILSLTPQVRIWADNGTSIGRHLFGVFGFSTKIQFLEIFWKFWKFSEPHSEPFWIILNDLEPYGGF